MNSTPSAVSPTTTDSDQAEPPPAAQDLDAASEPPLPFSSPQPTQSENEDPFPPASAALSQENLPVQVSQSMLEALGQICFGFVAPSGNGISPDLTTQPLDAQPAAPSNELLGIPQRTRRRTAERLADGTIHKTKEEIMNSRASTASPSPTNSTSESAEPPSPMPQASTGASPRLTVVQGAAGNGSASGNWKVSPSSISLLDGSVGPLPTIPAELDYQRAVASDPRRSVEERLEAYEDIIDSEIGDTTLSRARNIEREVGLRQIYLKFEGGNPSGTHKDRIAFAQAQDAVRRGFDAITAATCGNYGVAVALAASAAGLRCINFIPEGYHTRRTQELIKYGAQIVRVPGDYENAVVASREFSQQHEIYDANPGGANTQLQLRAYGTIAYEIYDELRDAPAVVAVPVSNGTTLAGIYRGFLSLYRRGKTSRMPRMVAASSFGKNPIIQAFMKSSSHCDDLKPEQIKETVVNEPLINWHSIDGDLALEGIRATGGWASYASDKSMLSYARFILEREALNVLPASTAGLAVLLERHRKEILSGDRYVVVLTGKRS